jgi:hypothetical protein
MNYWTCSRFADWLRGTDKPYALDSKGWKEWTNTAKSKHPIRYWIADDGLRYLQDAIFWIPDQLYHAKYYIVNRWIDQSHALVAHPKHIKPGQYRDMDYRILHCLFDELVNFVEIEKAYSNYRWSEEKQKGMRWWQVGRWRTRTWRSAEAGLQYLEWESKLTNVEWLPEEEKNNAELTSQAIAAAEIIALYKWWTEVYPNRPEPMDESGWSAYCDDKRDRGIEFLEDDPDEGKYDTKCMHDKMRKIEDKYEKEDTKMLVRLIKVRANLWT